MRLSERCLLNILRRGADSDKYSLALGALLAEQRFRRDSFFTMERIGDDERSRGRVAVGRSDMLLTLRAEWWFLVMPRDLTSNSSSPGNGVFNSEIFRFGELLTIPFKGSSPSNGVFNAVVFRFGELLTIAFSGETFGECDVVRTDFLATYFVSYSSSSNSDEFTAKPSILLQEIFPAIFCRGVDGGDV